MTTISTKMCDDCIARGRYSKTNLKIDLRELRREKNERKYLPLNELKSINDQLKEITKRIIECVECTCEL